MIELSVTLLSALLRTGLMLSFAVVLVSLLFRFLQVNSPCVRRTVCVVILLQGWFFAQWSVAIPVLGIESRPVAERFFESTEFLNRFATMVSARRLPGSDPTQSNSPIATPSAIAAAETFTVGSLPWPFWLLCLWAAGIIAISCRTLWLYVQFLRDFPFELSGDPVWESEWKTLQQRSGVRHLIPLYVTENTGPMLCRSPRGYRLIVPAKLWSEFHATQRISILRHELAHVQRQDVWKSLSVRVLALPHWFNPLAWWVVRQFDECSEWACDEAAQGTSSGFASDYARTLLHLAASSGPSSSLYPAARGRGLAYRVRRLLVSHDIKDSRMKKFSMAMLILGISLVSLMRIQLVAGVPMQEKFARPSETPSDSPNDRVRLPTRTAGRMLFGVGVNSDAGVIGQVVLNEDNFSTSPGSNDLSEYAATESGILRSEDADLKSTTTGINFVSMERQPSPAEVVVDINYLFTHLDEFEQERKKLKQEAAESQRELESLVKDIRSLHDRLTHVLSQSADESDTVAELIERAIAQKKAEVEVKRTSSRNNLLRKEALLYQKIYNKIAAEVAKYAREHGITIVRRTDRSAQRKKKIEAFDAKEILRRINQPVVYIENNELDITQEILESLQSKKKTVRVPASGGRRAR